MFDADRPIEFFSFNESTAAEAEAEAGTALTDGEVVLVDIGYQSRNSTGRITILTLLCSISDCFSDSLDGVSISIVETLVIARSVNRGVDQRGNMARTRSKRHDNRTSRFLYQHR
jgi:hypothetical protein